MPPLLLHHQQAASVPVCLMGVLGTLLGGRGVAQRALSLSRSLDAALVTKTRAGVLMEEQAHVSG